LIKSFGASFALRRIFASSGSTIKLDKTIEIVMLGNCRKLMTDTTKSLCFAAFSMTSFSAYPDVDCPWEVPYVLVEGSRPPGGALPSSRNPRLTTSNYGLNSEPVLQEEVAIDLPKATDVRCAAAGDLRRTKSTDSPDQRALAAASVYRNTNLYDRKKLLITVTGFGKIIKITFADGGYEYYKPENPLVSADVYVNAQDGSLVLGSGNEESSVCNAG